MFRDDLKAAVARAEQLERELAESERRASAAEDELEQLRGKLRFAERELEKLRLRRPYSPQQPRRRRRVLLLGAAALVLLTAVGVGAYLFVAGPDETRTATGIATTPAPKIPRPESSGSFEGFVRRVRRDCKVSSGGYLRKCKPKDLPQQLRVAEERVGAQNAAMTYCRLLDEGDRTLRAVAAKHLGGFYSRRLEALDARIFRCLDRYVRRGGAHRNRVADVWAKVGTRLGHANAIARYLRTAPSKVRASGLRGLWSYGRLQVLPEFRRYFASGDEQQVRTALQALTNLRSDAEHAAVCPLIAGLVERHARDQRTAARATYNLALMCHRSHAKQVLDNVERALGDRAYRKQRFDYWWLAAVGSCARSYVKPTRETRRRAIAVARRLAHDTSLSPLRRAQALRVLGEIDRLAGAKEAERLRDGPKELRKEAKRQRER